MKLVSGKSHVFCGWLLNVAKQPAGQFSFVLKGFRNFSIPVSTGVASAGVADFFKNSALSDTDSIFHRRPPRACRGVPRNIQHS